jgi:hypothetical protein
MWFVYADRLHPLMDALALLEQYSTKTDEELKSERLEYLKQEEPWLFS